LQAPSPSQVETGVKVPAVHEAEVHTWLVLTFRQAPAPSQVPSLPHCLVGVSSTQDLWGFCPVITGAHVPSALPVMALLHALQPVQTLAVVSQQTPSTQFLLAQVGPSWQSAPFDEGTNASAPPC
jgi:hypothetical protein